MNDTFSPFSGIFLGLIAIALFFLLFRIGKELRHHKIRHFGDRAEKIVASYLKREFPTGSAIFHNVYLKKGASYTQIDHILICRWGLFVIETKSHNGKINTEKDEWVQLYGEKIVRFHSPLLQNRIHQSALEALLKENGVQNVPVSSLVVFTSEKVSFTKEQKGVLRLSELGPFIKSGKKTSSRITAKKSPTYLKRTNILRLEKIIKENQIRSKRKQMDHERTVRFLDKTNF